MAGTKTYPYVAPQPNLIVPWIPVSLGSQKTHRVMKHSVMALVDSGADVCLCSEDIAAFLGKMVTDSRKRIVKKLIAADGKQFSSYRVVLNLFVCGHTYECPFYITNTLPHVQPVILGQRGFFSEHQVQFDFRQREISTTPY